MNKINIELYHRHILDSNEKTLCVMIMKCSIHNKKTIVLSIYKHLRITISLYLLLKNMASTHVHILGLYHYKVDATQIPFLIFKNCYSIHVNCTL